MTASDDIFHVLHVNDDGTSVDTATPFLQRENDRTATSVDEAGRAGAVQTLQRPRGPVVIAAPPHHGGGVYNHVRRTPDDVRHHRPGPLGGRHIRRDGGHRTAYGGGACVCGRDTDGPRPHPHPPRRRGAGVSRSARVRAPRLNRRDTPRRVQTPRVSVRDAVTPSGVPDLSVWGAGVVMTALEPMRDDGRVAGGGTGHRADVVTVAGSANE